MGVQCFSRVKIGAKTAVDVTQPQEIWVTNEKIHVYDSKATKCEH